MIRKLTINDFEIVESIISKLHKMHVEIIAKDIGAKRIDLTVWQFNKTAMNFYKSLGMKTQRKILETRLE